MDLILELFENMSQLYDDHFGDCNSFLQYFKTNNLIFYFKLNSYQLYNSSLVYIYQFHTLPVLELPTEHALP